METCVVDAEAVTRFRAVIGRLARDLNATATDEGLTPTQASVLGLVASRGPIGLAELNELEGSTRRCSPALSASSKSSG